MSFDLERRGDVRAMVMARPYTAIVVSAEKVRVIDGTAVVTLAPKPKPEHLRRGVVPHDFPSNALWVDVASAARFVTIPRALRDTAIGTIIAPHLTTFRKPWAYAKGRYHLFVKDPAIQESDGPTEVTIKDMWAWVNDAGAGVSLGHYKLGADTSDVVPAMD